MEDIGKFIKRLRMQQGLTQKEFAERIGINEITVNRWENNKTVPSYYYVEKIFLTLNVNILDYVQQQRECCSNKSKKSFNT